MLLGRLPDRRWSRIQRSGVKNAAEAEGAEFIRLGIEANGYQRFPIENQAAPEKGLYEGALRTPWQQFLAALIMSKDDTDYEANWAKGVKELESMGAATIVEGYKKVFKRSGIGQ